MKYLTFVFVLGVAIYNQHRYDAVVVELAAAKRENIREVRTPSGPYFIRAEPGAVCSVYCERK